MIWLLIWTSRAVRTKRVLKKLEKSVGGSFPLALFSLILRTMVFAFLLFIPLVVGGMGFLWSHFATKNSSHTSTGVTWKEFLAQIVVQAAIAGISAAIIYNANTGDIEVWNGVVTKKEKAWTSCEHDYKCNCHQVESCSGTGKNRSCSSHEECDTCYEHSNDWDWDVHNSIGEVITIDRIDRRGSNEPPRWTAVKMGEPTAHLHRYTSYIKAAPGSLFREQGDPQYAKHLPEYPSAVFDYYRLNRLVLVNGARVENPRAWNQELSEINANLGHAKQVNMIVVLVKDLPSDYFYALRNKWIGGKKNDLILVVGVDAQNTPKWARVMAWTTNHMVEIKLRDAIMDLPELTQHEVMLRLSANVRKFYQRKPMSDFEYLTSSITPTTTQWAVSMGIGVLLSIGLTIFFHFQDPFGDDYKQRRFWRRRY